MKTPLARLNLLHDLGRTVVAMAGVAFAVVLILMQLGFYGSVRQTATRIYDRLNFDLVLASPQYVHLSRASVLPKRRLYQARGLPEVADVSPFYLGFSLWQNPETLQRRGILVMGFDPSDDVFDLPDFELHREQLKTLDTALLDEFSRSEFGDWRPGFNAEIGRRRVDVVGQFALGTGFTADGAVLVSDRTFVALSPHRSLDQMSLGLIQLHQGAQPNEVAARLRKILPADVQVFTRAELEQSERRHWITKTSVGIIFFLGVVVAFIVGMAITYQVLASDVAAHLPEYATLKAIGHNPQTLTRVVVRQAWILAIAGFLPGLAISLGLYALTRAWANVPVDMTLGRLVGVLLVTILMCTIAAVASLRRIHRADPADLF